MSSFAAITTQTSFGTTDVLVGIPGSTNGGVYLSGDSGESWTQLNQGFDPNSLNISTLVKTSCGGCPVQYYSGTYGSGVYTRTIAVVAPPQISGWCFGSTSCTCGTTLPSGPSAGGQPFKICGANFQRLPTVQFGYDAGRASVLCSWVSTSVLTCSATPPSTNATQAPGGGYPLRVINTDTRVGYAAAMYTYTP